MTVGLCSPVGLTVGPAVGFDCWCDCRSDCGSARYAQEAAAEPPAEGQLAGAGRRVAGRGDPHIPTPRQNPRHHSGTHYTPPAPRPFDFTRRCRI